jgi:hypothetical protein
MHAKNTRRGRVKKMNSTIGVLAVLAVVAIVLFRRRSKTLVTVKPPVPVVIPMPVAVEVQPVPLPNPPAPVAVLKGSVISAPPVPSARISGKKTDISPAPKDSSPCGGRGAFTDFILTTLFAGNRTAAELTALARVTVPELCADPAPCEHSNDFCWEHSLRWDMQPLRVQGLITHSGAKPFKPSVWSLTAEGIAHLQVMANMLKTKGATAS